MRFWKKASKPNGLTAIGLGSQGVSMVRVAADGARPRIVDWDFRPAEAGRSAAQLVAGLVGDHQLKQARCTTFLNGGDYQLLLTEAPDVQPEELRAAVRWRIKDLIGFHINDASLDVFDLPGEAAPGRAREMYVVAARNPAIQERVDLLDAAGVDLQVIDIPELAQRNVAALLPEDAEGVALLALKAASGMLTLTRNGDLYLSRSIGVGADGLAQEAERLAVVDQIVLEIQRSLDYFESHFRSAPIRHLVLAPMTVEVPGLLDHLRGNLNLLVSPLDVNTLVDAQQPLPAEFQARCLTTIGAALRREAKAL
ncbi:MAG TPA: pilus assembly protein PilM [Acidiferrobacterales bacterium]